MASEHIVKSFDDQLKKLHFDTCNYSQDAIALLLKVAGVKNVVFGPEKPGEKGTLILQEKQTAYMVEWRKQLHEIAQPYLVRYHSEEKDRGPRRMPAWGACRRSRLERTAAATSSV